MESPSNRDWSKETAMRFAIVSQLALAASLTSLACSGAKNYQVNAIFPVEGNEGLEPKVDALLKERGYAVYDKDAGHRRMAELGFVENEYAPGAPLVTADRQRGCGLLSILCKKGGCADDKRPTRAPNLASVRIRLDGSKEQSS